MFGWILKGVGLAKTGWALFAPYRMIAMAVALGGVLITALVFYGNCRANAVALEAAYLDVKELKLDLAAARVELQVRNDRIADINKRHLQELAAAKEVLAQAVEVGQQLREERDNALEDLGVARFELLEAIRDDEEMADWVDWDVPVSAWGLLRAAAEGS